MVVMGEQQMYLLRVCIEKEKDNMRKKDNMWKNAMCEKNKGPGKCFLFKIVKFWKNSNFVSPFNLQVRERGSLDTFGIFSLELLGSQIGKNKSAS